MPSKDLIGRGENKLGLSDTMGKGDTMGLGDTIGLGNAVPWFPPALLASSRPPDLRQG